MLKSLTDLRGLIVLAFAFVAICPPRAAFAEASQVRLARQTGLPFLPMIIAERQSLIEKQAQRQRIDVKSSWVTLGNATATMEVLLGGQIDIIAAGLPTLATLWDRTAGTPQEIKSLGALNAMPNVLVTRNPRIKTIDDYGEKDRIALPAVKITAHAIILQMAVAKRHGIRNFTKLDHLTVSMPHPDAAAALLSGGSEIESHFSSPPFIQIELANPNVRQVLHSYEVTGGMLTNGLMITSNKFFTANPKLCAIVMSALREASAFIEASPREAARIYIEATGEKRMTIDDIAKIITDPDVKYSETPINMMKVIDFMNQIGSIKKKPASWRDFFFETAHGLDGS